MTDIFYYILLASFWSGVLTVLFLLVNKVFKTKLPISWHYYIWLVIIARLLFPFLITIDVEPKESTILNQVQIAVESITSTNNVPIMDNFENIKSTQHANVQTKGQIVLSSTKDVGQIKIKQIFQVSSFFYIWIAIASIVFIYKYLSYFFYAKKLISNCIVPSEYEVNVFVKQKNNLNMKGNIVFLKNKQVQTPFVMGIINMLIILPDKDYSGTHLNYIFHHELIHIKRHDIWIKWLYEIAKSIYWFNPFVYIASKNASFYCEASCDEVVLKDRTISERKEYSMIIIDLIAQTINQKTPMCVSMYSNKSNLKKRIQYILNSGQSKKNVELTLTIATIVFLLSACSSINIQEISPQSDLVDKVEITIDKTEDTKNPVKQKTNILIAGVTGDSLFNIADTIMIASFDTKTNQVSVLSIPRDTFLSPSEDTVLELKKRGIEIPSIIKAGEVTGYAKGNDMEYLKKEISNTLDIPIDYYIRMDMEAFKKIVDSLGGVTMTIPEGGLYYSDLSQGLEIALDEGIQLLDGENSLKFVRYRKTYKNGDLDRIVVQQQLLQEIYSKVVSSDNLIEKSKVLLSVLTENTKTNVSLSDFTYYFKYISKINDNDMKTFQLPVEVEQIDSRLYAIIDKREFENSIAGVFR